MAPAEMWTPQSYSSSIHTMIDGPILHRLATFVSVADDKQHDPNRPASYILTYHGVSQRFIRAK